MKTQHPKSPTRPTGGEFAHTNPNMKPTNLFLSMRSKTQALKFIAAAVLAAAFLAPSAFAASQTWTNAPVDQIWTNGLNWVGSAFPGATNSVTTTDVATFNEPVTTFGGVASPIIYDDLRSIRSILFDTAAGAYVFLGTNETAGDFSGQLFLGHTGNIMVNPPVTSPQTFSGTVRIALPSSTNGRYDITNNATSPNGTLYFENIFNSAANTRPTTIVLAGSNTGTNTVATITDAGTATANSAISGSTHLIKTGPGTWILSRANFLPDVTRGGDNLRASIEVNEGKLIVQDGGAFGGIVLPSITNGATLQLDNVTLNQASLAVYNGVTIRMNGGGTVSGLTLGTALNTTINLATTSASDLLIIGTPGLTAGVPSGIIHAGGPGTILLNQDNPYLGSWILDGGALQLGASLALGAEPRTFTFGPSSTGKLQLNAFNLLLEGLVSDATPGTPVVENGGASPAVLTVSNSVNNTFAGVLQDGTGGSTLSLVKEGTATLNLTGASTFSGNTINNFGKLVINNTSGSGLGSGSVTVASGATLAGGGTITGLAQIQSGGILAPGNSVGTITVGSLTMDAGSLYNFEFNSSPANDRAVVTSVNGLTVNGGAFNIYSEGGVVAYTTLGTYRLIQYSGTIGGTGIDATWTTASGANPHIANPQAGLFYKFDTTSNPGFLSLTISLDPAAIFGAWTNSVDGVWTTAANWNSNPNVPKLAKNSATLGVATALRTVTLDASLTNGAISFTNNNSFVVVDSGGKTLSLDNAGAGVVVAVTGGTLNSIQPAVALNDNATINVNSTRAISISGAIANTAGAKSLTLNGAGTVALSGNNSYGPAAGTVGTTVSGGGIVQVGHNNALGAGDVNMTTANATIKAGATGLTVPNNIAIATLLTGTVDNNGNDLTLSGVISGNGGLTKVNSGKLTLSGTSSYAGKTTVTGGILSISSDANLGTAPGAATPGQIRLDGGDLLGTTTFTVGATRGIGIGPVAGAAGTNALLDASTGSEFRLDGIMASAGNTGTNGLIVNSLAASPGKVILGGANSFNGPTVIANGVLQLANSLALTNSTLNYNSGTLLFDSIAAATLGGISCANVNQTVGLTNLAGGAVTLTVGANNATTTFGGSMIGLGGLTKVGTGLLFITSSNNYSGQTIASGTGNAGRLIITNGGSIQGGAVGGTSGGIRVDGGYLGSVGALTFGTTANPFTMTAGTAVLDTLRINNNDAQLMSVTGGNLTITNWITTRTINIALPTFTAPAVASTTGGIYINGPTAVVTIQGTLGVGDANANSGGSARIDSGSVTNNGLTIVGRTTNTRISVFQLNGGYFTSTETNEGIVLGTTNGVTGNNAELYVSGGTNFIEKICFGRSADTNSGSGWLVINDTTTTASGSNTVLYLGSGGIVRSNFAYTYTFSTNIVALNPCVTNIVFDANINDNVTNVYCSATNILTTSTNFSFGANISLMRGTLGAKADWSTTNEVRLSVTNFTIKAADIANVAHNITLGGVLSGPGNLTKTGGGTLTLSRDDTSSGTTTNSAGTLALTGNAGITNSPIIALLSSSVLDVSGRTDGTFRIGVSRTQSLIGTGSIVGGLFAGPLATVAPGFSIGTLTVSGAVTLGGTNIMELDRSATPKSDRIVSPSITAGGTLTVLNIGATLQGGDTFQLFSSPVTGAFTVTNLPALPGGMIWSNSLAINGSLTVIATVNQTPTNITTSVSGNVLTLSWPADHIGWRLQAQTNSLSVGLRSNWVDVAGSTSVNTMNFPINPANGSVFYRMVYP